MPARKKHPRVTESSAWLRAAGVIAIAAPVCFPLFTSQLPDGHDAFFYHPRLVEFHESIARGILLPRWAPDLEAGAGQPLFLFNPPLVYYIAEIWHLLGFDSVVSFNLTAIAAIIASAMFMFLFADYQFGRKAGWLATAAYLYAPYFHVDIFVRHAFSELMAFPFYPLALYGFSRYSRERNLRFLVLGALAWSAVMLSHNPSALLFSPVLLVFITFLGWKSRSIRLIVGMLSGILIGVGMAAFVWVPALAELRFVYIERSLQASTNYLDHFVYLTQLWSRTWGFGSSIPGAGDQLSFSFGLGHLLLIPAAAWLIFSGKREVLRTWFILLGSTLVILAILMTPLSLWLWEHMPLLKQVQFPWRILADGILVMAAMAGVYAASLENRLHSALWFWIGMALLILPNLSHIGFEKYYPVIASEWTPAAIAANAIETTANAEFEPRWVKQRMPYTDNKAFVVSGSAVITRIERRPTFWQLKTQGQTDALIEAALLYFPGWTVSVDGRNAPIEISETGRIQFRVPSGMHQVSMEFKRTTARFLAELVSLLTLSSVIVLAYFLPGPHSK